MRNIAASGLSFLKTILDITANNPEQEQAEEVVAVQYSGAELEIGFNVSYLLDVLSVLEQTQVRLLLV